MKRNLFAIFLALALVVALAFVAAPKAQAATYAFTANDQTLEISEDSTLDLAGFSGKVVLSNDAKLTVYDSGNTNVTGEDAGKLTVEGNGTVEKISLQDGYRYLKVDNGDGTYSFHPFNMAFTHIGLNTKNNAVCLRVAFVANKVIKDNYLTEYGICSIDEDRYVPANEKYKFGDKYGAYAFYDVTNSFGDDDMDDTKTFKLYMKVDGETVVTDYTANVVPREVLKQLNKAGPAIATADQLDRIEAMMEGNARVNNILSNFRSSVADTKLDFSSAAQRLSQTTSQQVWQNGSVLLTNNKASATSNVVGDVSPVKFYANTSLTIECAGMKQIVFNCNSTTYATAMKNSFANTNSTVTAESKVVTVVFNEAVDSVTVTMTAQSRVDSLVVTAPVGGACDHIGGNVTCTALAICLDCDQPYGELAEHNITSTATCQQPSQCSVCGDVGKTVDCKDDNTDGLCDWCGTPLVTKEIKTESLAIYGSTGTVNSTKTEITWTAASGEFTFTNTKGSTAIRTSDTSHYRVYAGGNAIVTSKNGAKITQIVITCTGSSYVPTFANVAGATIEKSGTTVTVTLDEGVDSITLEHTGSSQWRLSKIAVTYEK